MRAIVLVAVLVLGGCSNPAKDAERQYEIVAKSGDNRAACAAAERVAAAYLKAQDQAGYLKWKRTADGECATARLLDTARGR